MIVTWLQIQQEHIFDIFLKKMEMKSRSLWHLFVTLDRLSTPDHITK